MITNTPLVIDENALTVAVAGHVHKSKHYETSNKEMNHSFPTASGGRVALRPVRHFIEADDAGAGRETRFDDIIQRAGPDSKPRKRNVGNFNHRFDRISSFLHAMQF